MSVGCDFQCVFGGLAVGRRRRDRLHRVASFAVVICAVAGLLTSIDSLMAQETAGDESRPKEEIRFRLYRWQEDYLWLSRKTEPLSDYERFKYIHLGGAPTNYLSLGGELRYRYDGYNPYLFGLTANGKPFGSNQERMFLHGDLHLTEYFRAFVQFDAAAEAGRPVQRTFDQSAPDLRQAFGDLILPTGKGTTTLRIGRQELWLGPSRWLAVRDPTNIRRSFDGALLEYRDDVFIFRGFAAKAVLIYPGLFDDPTSSSEAFRGFYLRTRRLFSLPVSVDLYLLDKQLDRVTYARGSGREDRWTGGGRAAGKLASLDYAIEGAYQFGTFGSADISAWGFFADVSRAFEGFGVTPRFGLRSHYASGDRNLKESTLRTFSAPYPAASVISEMSLLSVSNAFNLQPYVQLTLPYNLVLGVNWNWIWKATAADSVYGPIGTLITAPNSPASTVAQIGQVDMTWDVTRFLQVHALYAHIFAGDYIKAARGGDFDYYRLQIMTRF